MELNAAGQVNLRAVQYTLDDINTAIDAFKQGQFVGRAVILNFLFSQMH
jgi:D-arabinose 1-dehydrogenase-like Zn-dependent alcohol dehydrogenase